MLRYTTSISSEKGPYKILQGHLQRFEIITIYLRFFSFREIFKISVLSLARYFVPTSVKFTFINFLAATRPLLHGRRLTPVCLKDENVNIPSIQTFKSDKNIETERPWIIPQPNRQNLLLTDRVLSSDEKCLNYTSVPSCL